MASDPPNPLRALKSIVYGMGALIVVALAVLVYAIYARVEDPGFGFFKADKAAETGFGEVRIPLTEDCLLAEMRPDGNTLYLRTGPAGVCERIFLIDAGTGRLRGSLTLRP